MLKIKQAKFFTTRKVVLFLFLNSLFVLTFYFSYASYVDKLERESVSFLQTQKQGMLSQKGEDLSGHIKELRSNLRKVVLTLLRSGSQKVNVDDQFWLWVKVENKYWKSTEWQKNHSSDFPEFQYPDLNSFSIKPSSRLDTLVIVDSLEWMEGRKKKYLHFEAEIKKEALFKKILNIQAGTHKSFLVLDPLNIKFLEEKNAKNIAQHIFYRSEKDNGLHFEKFYNKMPRSWWSLLASLSSNGSRKYYSSSSDDETASKFLVSWYSLIPAHEEQNLVMLELFDLAFVKSKLKTASFSYLMWGLLLALLLNLALYVALLFQREERLSKKAAVARSKSVPANGKPKQKPPMLQDSLARDPAFTNSRFQEKTAKTNPEKITSERITKSKAMKAALNTQKSNKVKNKSMSVKLQQLENKARILQSAPKASKKKSIVMDLIEGPVGASAEPTTQSVEKILLPRTQKVAKKKEVARGFRIRRPKAGV